MTANLDPRIRLFLVSVQMVEHELTLVESALGVDLGRSTKLAQDMVYYPQIDAAIRSEAEGMAPLYEVFYSLEKSIRSTVSQALESSKGANWWNEIDCVPQKILSDVQTRSQRELDSGVTPRSDLPLDYTTFGELGEIIKTNWDVFGSYFSSPKAVERVMANLNTLRGPIAHCSLLAEDEVVRLHLSVRDWFRLME